MEVNETNNGEKKYYCRKKTLNKLELCKGQNRDGHADIFADAHRCGNPHYPTYVGYSAKYAAHISDRHPICIRMAIPLVQNNDC